MGPFEDPPGHPENQVPARRKTAGRKRRARRPRHRVCLLKGCPQRFRPIHPLSRYCREGCRRKARRWSQWKARQRYRQSANGKQKRQAQSGRYRGRRQARKKLKEPASRARGSSEEKIFECSCDRPGCYETFRRTRRSPLQRFCSHGCRRALERVLERERRWRAGQLAWGTPPSRYGPDILRPPVRSR